MKRFILFGLLATAPAFAQQSTPPAAASDPAQTALSQEIMACISEKVQLRSRIIALETELAKMKSAPPPGAAPKSE